MPKMAANYRKQAYEDVVPVVKQLIDAKAKRLNIADLKSYDLSLSFLPATLRQRRPPWACGTS